MKKAIRKDNLKLVPIRKSQNSKEELAKNSDIVLFINVLILSGIKINFSSFFNVTH